MAALPRDRNEPLVAPEQARDTKSGARTEHGNIEVAAAERDAVRRANTLAVFGSKKRQRVGDSLEIVQQPNGIDIDSIPVDSDAFTGGFVNIQAFDTNNQSATFTGTPLQAILDTKEVSDS